MAPFLSTLPSRGLSHDPQGPDCLSRPNPPPPSPESDWAGLQDDVLALILKRIKLMEEIVRFGSVCKSWRTLALDKRYLAPQVPWLMLPNYPDDKYHWQIYSLSKEYILTKNFYSPELYDKRCIGLDYGWVLTITRLGGQMSLVHPILHRQIELPPHTSIEGYIGKETNPSYIFFSRVTLCGNPSESSDFTVIAVHITGSHVYCWKFGCKYWNSVDVAYGIKDGIQDVSCYQDQIYAVTFKHKVMVLKNDHEGSIVPHLIGKIDSMELSNEMYIVGSTHGLLVVARYREEVGGELVEEVGGEHGEVGGEHEEEEETEIEVPEEEEETEIEVPEEVLEDEIYGGDWLTTKFSVVTFDLINGGYEKTTNLGDRAIFVGNNNSICFDHASELTGIKSNHIYFTDDNFEQYVRHFEGGGKDMGVYNMEDGRITQFKIDESSYRSRSRICPPFWFIPSL